MGHYLDYLKALIGHLHHDAATFYANWKGAEAKAKADAEAASKKIGELEGEIVAHKINIQELEARARYLLPSDDPQN